MKQFLKLTYRFYVRVRILSLTITLLLIGYCNFSYSQTSLLNIVKDPLKVADQAYIEEHYALAARNYQKLIGSEGAPRNLSLRLARSYFLMHDYNQAVKWYNQYEDSQQKMAAIDQLYYAEALVSMKQYKEAIQYYTSYLEGNQNNPMISAKIWRLNNLTYLYEDSLKNAVHFAEINSTNSELQALRYKNGVVLTSNTPKVNFINRIDENKDAPFYHLSFATVQNDPFSIGAYFYGELLPFAPKLAQAFNIGPIAFANNGHKMIYAASSEQENAQGYRNMQLYTANYDGIKWSSEKLFPYNSQEYTIGEASISEDGNTLYFSSNQEGGFGGFDLYVCYREDEAWTKPQNLGERVNTAWDEKFPFIHHGKTLYFSSNGHPGLGGLDIFKANIVNEQYGEIENLGYPINSSFDDFAFSIDSLKRQGFVTSNRLNGGLDDDIYEVDLNLQSYPLKVSGIAKFIEHNWMDSTQLEILAGVTLKLIDITTNTVVAEDISDENGGFNFTVPYFSHYKIQVTGKDLDGQVSFEVPKYAKEEQNYEIVVVNDDFKKIRE